MFTAYSPAAESLSDYMGIPIAASTSPIGASGTLSHVSLWHRAYNLIWNEWFRDQNLQDSVVVDLDDGPDSISDYVLLKRGKRHDYFTSCLPWTQKNNTGTAVSVGLAGTAPVTGLSMRNANSFGDMSAYTMYDAKGVVTNKSYMDNSTYWVS